MKQALSSQELRLIFNRTIESERPFFQYKRLAGILRRHPHEERLRHEVLLIAAELGATPFIREVLSSPGFEADKTVRNIWIKSAQDGHLDTLKLMVDAYPEAEIGLWDSCVRAVADSTSQDSTSCMQWLAANGKIRNYMAESILFALSSGHNQFSLDCFIEKAVIVAKASQPQTLEEILKDENFSLHAAVRPFLMEHNISESLDACNSPAPKHPAL